MSLVPRGQELDHIDPVPAIGQKPPAPPAQPKPDPFRGAHPFPPVPPKTPGASVVMALLHELWSPSALLPPPP